MRRNSVFCLKLVLLFLATVILTLLIYATFEVALSFYHNFSNPDGEPRRNPVAIMVSHLHEHALGRRSIPDAEHQKVIVDYEKIDWTNYELIAAEKLRDGIGEHGVPAKVPPEREEERKKLYDPNGYNGLLSDMISLNRSVPDIRHKDCATVKYLKKLPSVSVVIPFFNEHWSTLLRSCYSILNRSPAELINEIILVDDHSIKDFLKQKLDEYVSEHLPKVKILRLPERSGLITARIAGAKVATGEVLLFLDAHVEANTNWLPPLLEPIAENYKVCTCPFIDLIDDNTFEYHAQDEGARGSFDWQFQYKRLPLLPDDLAHPIKPFKSPVMAGGLFAISAKFFWELGGYDEGLDIWGGEQYELSFKIWQCGGEIYDAPCSRIGHVYRGSVKNDSPRTNDYLHKNFKRVAEVWMDEYKEYLYSRIPMTYAAVDAGDLSKMLALRKNLQCKPFKWFMEEVAFDLVIKYPPVLPPDLASGTIRNLGTPHLCADTMGNANQQVSVGLFLCATNPKEPQGSQFFSMSWEREIRLRDSQTCWEVDSDEEADMNVFFEDCDGDQEHQAWRYDMKTKWLTVGGRNKCLEADSKALKLIVNTCDMANKNMQWEFGFINETAFKAIDNA